MDVVNLNICLLLRAHRWMSVAYTKAETVLPGGEILWCVLIASIAVCKHLRYFVTMHVVS